MIASLLISFTGEMWRLGENTTGRLDRLDFQISFNATSLTTGTWADVNGLDFVTPTTTGATGSRDGNAAGNRTAISFNITSLTIANGATFWIRWVPIDATGAGDDGLAIDDFSLTPTVVQPGALSIDDVSHLEGDSGSTLYTFTVTRSGGSSGAVGATWTITGAGTGDLAAGQPLTGTVSFANGEISKTITVNVAGDYFIESDESFTVTLSAPTGGVTISDATGIGTITNDDVAGAISIDDVSHSEGQGGTTLYTFTVSRTGQAANTSVQWALGAAGGAGNAGATDFPSNQAPSGTITFAPGETSRTIIVSVLGDHLYEPNESFTITLSNPTAGATIADGTGIGTILNDDSAPPFAPDGNETTVNQNTALEQTLPRVAWIDAGHYVVTWTSMVAGSPDSYEVMARMFNADGTPAGNEFQVNTTSAGDQVGNRVATLSGGGFVIVWSDQPTTDIRAQMFNADGSRHGGELLLNTDPNGQSVPWVSALPGGGFAAVWMHNDGVSYDIRGRTFDADGQPVSAEFAVNTNTALNQQYAQMTTLTNGHFVVVWHDNGGVGGDASSTSIKMRVFDTNGTPLTAETLVNTTIASQQQFPAIGSLAGGGYVVVWEDYSASGGDTSGNALRAQIYDASGNRVGSEFIVNFTTEGDQSRPTVAGLPDGGFVVGWWNQADGFGVNEVRAQAFDALGNRRGGEFEVNSDSSGDQLGAAFAVSPTSGHLVATWIDYNDSQELTDGEIEQRLFTLDLPPNTAPVIAGLDGDSVGWTEASSGPAILDGDALLAVTDATSPNFDGGTLTVTVSANGVSDEDVLSLENHPGSIELVNGNVVHNGIVIGTWTGGTGGDPLVFTFNAAATALGVTALMRNLTYDNSSQNPDVGTRQIAYTLTDGDGGSTIVHSSVTLTPYDDDPVIGNLDGDSVNWHAGDGPVFIDAGGNATLTDVDSAHFGGYTFKVQSAFGGEDSFDIAVANGVTYDATNVYVDGFDIGDIVHIGTGYLQITLDADATAGRVEQLIRSVTVTNLAPVPTLGGHDIDILLYNNTASAEANATFNVVAGTLSVGDRVFFDADNSGNYSAGDTGLDGITIDLVAGNGILLATTVTGGGGLYSFSGLVAGDYYLLLHTPDLPPGLVSLPGAGDPDDDVDGDNNGVYGPTVTGTLVFTLTEGGEPDTAVDGNGTNSNFTVDFGFTTDTPIIDLDGPGGGTGYSAGYTEGQAGVAITDFDVALTSYTGTIQSITITLSDRQPGDELFVSGSPTGPEIQFSLYDPNTGTITITHTGASVADFREALTHLRYRNTGINPTLDGTDAERTISFVVNDGVHQSAPATTTLFITAVNTPATIGGTTSGSIIEDISSSTGGQLTIDDPDSADVFVAYGPTAGSGGYGSFSLTEAGLWTYQVNAALIQFLGAGDSATDTILAVAADGNGQLLTVTINGANDAAGISGDDAGAVTEDSGATVGGQLAIIDVDQGEALFNAMTGYVTAHGTFSIDASGAWSYTLDDARDDHIRGGVQTADTITISSPDGTTHDIVITITGVNDAGQISGDFQGDVTEDIATGDSGTLGISDADDGEAFFLAQSLAAGTYGSFTLTSGGAWTYTLVGGAAQALGAGDTDIEQFQVTTVGGDIGTVTINVHGVNDAPSFGGDSTGTVTEDGTTADSGTLTVNDVDTGESSFQTQTAAATAYGAFSIDADGNWSYQLDNMNAAVQALDSGESMTDTINVASLDGTQHQIVITINGVDEPLATPPGVDLDGGAGGIGYSGGYTEGGPAAAIGNAIEVTQGTFPITRATITLADPLAGDALALAGSLPATITVLSNNGTELVLAGTGTPAQWAAALALVRFASSSDNPDAFGADTARTINVVLGDGVTTGAPATATIAIAAVNDAPVLGGLNGDTVTFTEGDPYVVLDNNAPIASVTDADNLNFAGGFIQIGVMVNPKAEDEFFVLDIFPGVGTVGNLVYVDSVHIGTITNSGPGEILRIDLNINATAARVATLLDYIAYRNVAGDNPTAGDRSVGWLLNDGHGGADAAVSTVNVVAVADPPLAVDDSLDATEDMPVTYLAADLLGNDSDGGDGGPLVITSVSNATGGTALLNVDGSVTFTPTANFNGVAGFDYVVSDGTASDTGHATVNVAPVNDSAILSADVRNLTETNSATDISSSGTLTITDVDNPATFVAQAGTAGAYGTFAINAAGAWTYTASSAHNEFVSGMVYTDSFSVASSDGTTTSVTINITGTNDAAILSADVRNLTETNSATDISASGTLTIGDVDNPATFVAQANTVGSYGTFSINAAGAWTFTASSAHNEFAAGTVYTDSFTVASSDGTTTSVTINITGTNDSAILSADVRNLTETNSATDISSSGTLTITDVDSPATFVAQAGTAGSYGTFAINAAGAWTYVASSAHDEFAEGAVYSDAFTVASVDGTTTSVTINITGSNDAPSGADATIAAVEDTPRLLSQADFGFTDPDIGDAFSAVIITGVAGGTLYYDADGTGGAGLPVAVGSLPRTFTAAELAAGSVSYQANPNLNGTGVGTISFQVVDDSGAVNGSDPSINTLTVNVTAVNDAPAGTSSTIVINEDAGRVLTAADFGYSDTADGNAFAGVVLTSLPTAGFLIYDADGAGGLPGVFANVGRFITAAELAMGALTYFPASHANGAGSASFTFQVRDDGGTSAGGQDTDQSPNTISFDINPVNDAPSGTSTTITINEDVPRILTQADFGFSDPVEGQGFAGVAIATLPTNGNLLLNGVAVTVAGTFVSAAQIGAGQLVFAPGLNGNGAGYASFTFQVRDDGGTANGGQDTDQSPNILTFDVTPVNDVPSGADKTVIVSEDDTYTFAVADFGFTDTDGNAFASVFVNGVPAQGALLLSGVQVVSGQTISTAAINAGLLTFTPDADEFGTNYAEFSFQVQDDGGGSTFFDPSSNKIIIDVTPDNLPPVVDLNGAGGGANYTTTYVEDGAAAAIGGGVIVTDPNSGFGDMIESATITLTDRVAGDSLTLSGALPPGITAATTSLAGSITIQITGPGTGAQYQALIQSIVYATTSQDPTVGGTDLARTITVTVNDGTISSAVATTIVNVTAVDDAAVARGDSFGIDETAVLSSNVFLDHGAGVDFDVDGPGLVVSAVNGSSANVGQQILLNSGALLRLSADGSFTYDTNHAFDRTPAGSSGAANTPARDSFTYTLAGGGTATVALVLAGLDTDDTLLGTAGADILAGGNGNDIYFVENSADQVIEAVGQGFDAVFSSASYGLAAGTSVEVLSAVDWLATTALSLTGNALANILYGNAGDNVLDGGGGADSLSGFGGHDVYFVDNAADIVAEANGGGFDTVYTSVSYSLGAGVYAEVLSTANWLGTGALNLTGNELDNRLYGNAGANVLTGGNGADWLSGLGGGDTLIGGAGDDVYWISAASDAITETAGAGYDTAYLFTSYALAAGADVEVVSTFNWLGTEAITLTGNGLANTLFGNAGANILNGGTGADYLAGFGGADTFAFTSALGGGNIDTIADFVAGTDKIALDDAIFTAIAGGTLSAGAFVTGSAAADADDRIIYNSATGALFYDADGSGAGAAIQFATIGTGLTLAASDFTVI